MIMITMGRMISLEPFKPQWQNWKKPPEAHLWVVPLLFEYTLYLALYLLLHFFLLK